MTTKKRVVRTVLLTVEAVPKMKNVMSVSNTGITIGVSVFPHAPTTLIPIFGRAMDSVEGVQRIVRLVPMTIPAQPVVPI